MEDDLSKLLQRYRQGAVGWASAPKPARANKCQARLDAAYRALRETQAGRECLAGLMADPEPAVRVWAAAHSLKWSPDAARRALEELRDSEGPFSFTAEMTLEQFDRGRLTFDR